MKTPTWSCKETRDDTLVTCDDGGDLGADAEVLAPDGHLGAERALAGRDATDHCHRK